MKWKWYTIPVLVAAIKWVRFLEQDPQAAVRNRRGVTTR